MLHCQKGNKGIRDSVELNTPSLFSVENGRRDLCILKDKDNHVRAGMLNSGFRPP